MPTYTVVMETEAKVIVTVAAKSLKAALTKCGDREERHALL